MNKNLADFVRRSNLNEEDKNWWQGILAKLTGEQIKVLEDFVEEEPDLTLLTDNIKKKTKAFLATDKKAFQQIIQEEK